MNPSLAVNNHRNSAFADMVSTRKAADFSPLRREAVTNSFNVLLGKFSHVVVATAQNTIRFLNSPVLPAFLPAMLRVHISHIVGMCSDKKMGRVYTGPNITGMANEQSIGDSPNMQFVGKPMGGNGFVRSAPDEQLSIPARGFITNPQPTSCGFLNLLPEPFLNRDRVLAEVGIATCATAKLGLAFIYLSERASKRIMAVFAVETKCYRRSSHAVHPPMMNRLVRLVRRSRVVRAVCILACSLVLIGVLNNTAHAQTTDPILKSCEAVADELRVKRVEVEGLKQQITLRDERDKLRDQFEANQADQISFWREAATARKEALTIDDRIEKIRLEQIVEYKAEIDRLRAENDKLRRGKTKWLMAGVVLGAVMPKLP